MIYLDTHVVAALNRRELDRFSRRAQTAIERNDDLRISPLVLLELEFLHEIKRSDVSAGHILNELRVELGLTVCDTPFPLVINQALDERWTRDPFDRVIVAQARLNDAALITLDRTILRHYPNALA